MARDAQDLHSCLILKKDTRLPGISSKWYQIFANLAKMPSLTKQQSKILLGSQCNGPAELRERIINIFTVACSEWQGADLKLTQTAVPDCTSFFLLWIEAAKLHMHVVSVPCWLFRKIEWPGTKPRRESWFLQYYIPIFQARPQTAYHVLDAIYINIHN